ncbi:NAD(P)/FAD-dependent oxidoreductase [Nocardioides lijunqiniae]|uniref:NAD(P)/FAD-dependent oxidoreductase n=1 Tax=Nocardioides lijunqiniae TaxID=2760832 RepID=UPI00187758B0|nr:NAD(P)/FAD-dependent oxidoreductase [Nocardioides lijunqiniae]
MQIDQYDVIVVGGGPAGLQATLTLGRMHHRVLLLDSGHYRNDPADHLHNFVTRDGTPPAEFRALAHRDLDEYATVERRSVAVSAIEPAGANAAGDGFTVTLADGAQALARRVVLATGVRDTLPELPGLEPLWGNVVAHCPFCHGHEFAGGHVALLGAGPHTPRVALMVSRIADRVTVLTDGADLDDPTATLLAGAGIAVRADRVGGLSPSEIGATVSFEDGPAEEVAGIFVTTTLAQAAPFAEQLGLAMLPSGGIEIDVMGRTSVPGVYAAGDLAHVAEVPMAFASVLTAASAGLVAGAACVADLLAIDHRMPVPA